jgi:hypothetical protein
LFVVLHQPAEFQPGSPGAVAVRPAAMRPTA